MREAIIALLRSISKQDGVFNEELIDIENFTDKILKLATIIPIYKNGKLVAFTAFYDNDVETKTAFLTMLAVDKSFRQLGLGSFLLSTTHLYIEHLGFKRILLEVRKSNIAGSYLYKKVGYKVVEERSYSQIMEILI